MKRKRLHRTCWLLRVVYLVALLFVSKPIGAQNEAWSLDDDNTTTERGLEIANTMWRAGQRDKAEELFLATFGKARLPHERVTAANSLAEFYQQENKADRAIEIYESLLQDDVLAQDLRCLMYIYEGLGQTYDADGKHIKAIKSYREAEDILRQTQIADSAFASSLYAAMSKTLMQAGDINLAFSLIDTAMSYTRPTDIARLSDVVSTKSRIYALLGDYQKAYYGMEHTISLNIEQWNNQVNTLMNSTNPIYTQQRNEIRRGYEKQLQELGSRLDDAEASGKKAWGATIGIGLFAIVAVLGFVVAIGRLRDTEKRLRIVEQKYKDSERVISIVAHDATTQFNTLLGFASMQMDRAAETEADQETVEFNRLIYTSAQRLYQMMSNLLTWSRTKGQLKPKIETVNVSERLTRVVSICQMMANEKDIAVVSKIDPDVKALVDPSHLEIVIRNLLTNAIKFTPKKGNVLLSALMHGDRTSIIVEDNGVGMDEAIVNSFNNDERIVSTEGTEHEKGSGLGLTICRELVRSNNGEIIFNSSKGNGTSVSIVLRR